MLMYLRLLSFDDGELDALLAVCEPLPIDLRGRLLADLARVACAHVPVSVLIARLGRSYLALAGLFPAIIAIVFTARTLRNRVTISQAAAANVISALILCTVPTPTPTAPAKTSDKPVAAPLSSRSAISFASAGSG